MLNRDKDQITDQVATGNTTLTVFKDIDDVPDLERQLILLAANKIKHCLNSGNDMVVGLTRVGRTRGLNLRLAHRLRLMMLMMLLMLLMMLMGLLKSVLIGLWLV